MNIMIYYEQRGYGGVDTHMAHLINFWPNKNDYFTILSNHDNQGLTYLENMIRRKNFKIYRIKSDIFYNINSSGIIRKFYSIIRSQLLFLSKFSKILKRFNPDILISNNGGYPGAISSFIAVLVSRLFSFNKINTFLLIHHAPFGNIFVRKNADMFAFLIRKLNIKTLTVSKASKIALESSTPLKNIKYIYNGLEIQNGEIKSIDFYSNYNINQKKVIVGIIGPIDPHKGHSNLIKVYSSSKLLKEKSQLVIVGKGNHNLVNSLKVKVDDHTLNNNVTFSGFISASSLRIISGFDILLMPTQNFEGFGYSMAEAMSIGVPVIASNVGAIPEIIDNGKNGYIIEPEDLESWSKNILNLVVNPKLRVKIGNAGKQKIKESFSAIKMSQSYFNYITK